MKKKIQLILFLTMILAVLLGGKFVFKNYILKGKSNDLINISYLSEDFMNNYLEEISKIKTDEEKENMLIVISKKKIKNSYGAKKIIEAPNNQYILQYSSDEEKNNALKKLKENKNIESVEENIVYTIEDSEYNSWGIEAMSLDYAIDSSKIENLKDVTVAIIDTGCDLTLFNKYYSGKIVETYNALTDSTTNMTDENGHGTHIAGTIAEGTPSNVKIIPIKVSKTGSMYNTDIVTAINYVTYNEKADVINMSFGSYSRSASIAQAITAANEKNIISVAAAGNDNTSQSHYPSSLDNTISIASVDSGLNKSSFSNYGSKITFSAPGTDIKSIMSNNAEISKRNGNNDDDDHETISGTSMATPHAVSAVAILKSYNKNLTLDNVVELLKQNAIDLGTEGWDQYYGYGLISFESAQFCEGVACDEYNVFQKEKELVLKKIEIPYVQLTSYNYGSIYNLLNTPIKLYYSDDEYLTKKLWELDDLEIENYNPYKEEEQEINIKHGGYTVTANVPYPDNYQLGWEYNILDENSVELTLYKDNRENINKLYVPETIDGYNVVALGEPATHTLKSKVFGSSYDALSFEEVTLPKTLTKIGDFAFIGFSSLKKVNALADEVEIGEYAFSRLEKFKEFNGVISSLEMGAFSEDQYIDNIILSDEITSIPKSAFNNCTNLEHINLPESLISIGEHAFEFDYKLSNVNLPEGLKTIGRNAFSSSGIENITFPESLEEIGREAFYATNIKDLYITKNIKIIGNSAFERCSSIESIIVDEENTVYDSRDNSNALIETATNTLLKGIGSTIIPKSVTKIYSGSFSYDLRLEEIEIPSSVTEIGNYAFYECDYLTKIKIPRSVNTIGEKALKNFPAQREELGYIRIPLTVLTYRDAYAKTYAVDNEINYDTMDPSNMSVVINNSEFKAFEKVNINTDFSDIKLYYDIGKNISGSYVERPQFRQEDINDNYTIEYQTGNDSIRYGDEYYILHVINEYGEAYEKRINITVSKNTPTFDIPTDITADIGQKLSEIKLPEGFEWLNGDEVIEKAGNVIFKARYIPKDIVNYEIVDDIDITVNVTSTKNIIIPDIQVSDKTYDGTTNIDINSITISNLNSDEYTILILNSEFETTEVGNTTANITLRLSDKKFEEYTFDNGGQQKVFNISAKIVPAKVAKPTITEKKYTYTGEEQIIEFNGFDSNIMNIIGNKRTNAGQQNVFISLKNSNYIWEDDTTEELKFDFKIDKAEINVIDTTKDTIVKYDGLPHSIEMNLDYSSNTIIKYMDENNEYTLDDVPKYTEAGTYIIKYKAYIDDNYTEYFGQKTLIIEDIVPYVINKYSVDETNKYISKIMVNTEVNNFTSNIILGYGYGIDVDIKEINNKNMLYTGGKTKITKGLDTYREYTNAVIGDINGDGEINSADLLKIRQHLLGTNKLTGVYFLASDINYDDEINSADLLRVRQHLLGTKPIE